MNTGEIIAFLTQYNKWRRNEDESETQPNPTELGIVIGLACNRLADLYAQLEALKATLQDPVEVELDMIRGNIAIPHRAEFKKIAQKTKAANTRK